MDRFCVLSAVCICALAILQSVCSADVPPTMDYQGKLSAVDGQPVADGSYTMDFSIYAAPSGAFIPLWQEKGRSVTVQGGVFTTALGEVVPLPADVFAGDRWLQIAVNGSVLSPRTHLDTAPYAFRAHTAEHVLPNAAVTGLNALTGEVHLVAGTTLRSPRAVTR